MSEDVVWLVSEGEYSDYHVVCAVPNEDVGKQIAEAIGDRAFLESVPIRDDLPVTCDVLSCYAEIMGDGNFSTSAYRTGESVYREWGYAPNEPKQVECETHVSFHQYTPGRNGEVPRASLDVRVSGVDHERVRKRYSEVVAQTKAMAPVLVAKYASEQSSVNVYELEKEIKGL